MDAMDAIVGLHHRILYGVCCSVVLAQQAEE